MLWVIVILLILLMVQLEIMTMRLSQIKEILKEWRNGKEDEE